MTIDDVILVLNAMLPKPLTRLQELILRQAWEGKTYTIIAQEAYYGPERVRKVAADLWILLSQVLNESINKSNFRKILESRELTLAQQQLIWQTSSQPSLNRKIPLEFPDGPLSLSSRFYISRPPIEELAFTEIMEPGSVLRIKAPQKMGKSSLLLRIIAYANELNYRSVTLDFNQAEESLFIDLNKFLRWFCANVGHALDLESQLENYWDEDIGSKVSCTIYFQNYILEHIQEPIVLVLNEVNRIFEYPELAKEFFPMLRVWYEEARKIEIWQKLRLIVAYSTEIYVPLNLNQSPFNIGLPLSLPYLTHEQIKELAECYQLDWAGDSEIQQLMAMVGGHPYLVQLAMYHLVSVSSAAFCNIYTSVSQLGLECPLTPQAQLQELLQQAPTNAGIYKNHLRRLLFSLNQYPQLKVAFQQVIKTGGSGKIDSTLAYKLDSMGLITFNGDHLEPSCELYRRYFQEELQ
ncbi:AAA-like domain-containing protein [Planktothrix sp. FACHB-1365]|uniref:AAA-like domain-containing protein n=1 Tax=Planktothrix sp. FACHB-1365 TaxID=2692855 RepID=UPI001682DB9B|nr:AAA-like domain-containing protein [Planktothrix sp. FACHB-1365]MBD2482004.1 AAA-like domain-containing protein [Planktothrix sp. FACHB-1365]